MDQEKTLESITNLCNKVAQMIDDNTSRMRELEDKIKMLESRQAVLYTQKQVAQITGWSVAAINNWVKTGFILGVPVHGKKNMSIPASEVNNILSKKGHGRRFSKRA